MKETINKLMYAGVVGVTVFSLSTGVAFARSNDNFNNNNRNNNYQQNYPQLPTRNNQNNNWNNNNQNNSNNNSSNYFDQSDTNTNTEIANDGSVVMRNATVNSISGNTIYVSSTLGSATLNWTGTLDSGTRYEARNGSQINLSDLQVGDKVTVKGVISSGSTFALRVSLVRDITRTGNTNNPNPVNSQKQVFQGRLITLPGSSFPTSLVMTVGNTNYPVSLTGTTILLNNAWATIPLSSYQSGDTVRVFGYIPNGTSTIVGLVVRDISR